MHCFQAVRAALEHTLNYRQGQSLGICTVLHWQIKKTRKHIQFLNGNMQKINVLDIKKEYTLLKYATVNIKPKFSLILK